MSMKNILITLFMFPFFLSQAHALDTLIDNKEISGYVGKKKWQHYQIKSTDHHQKLHFSLTNVTGDADLYVRQNKQPERRWWGKGWDCRPYKGKRRDEHCDIDNKGDAIWYVSIYGSRSSSFQLKVSIEKKETNTVYLLLHGLNSDPDTWEQTVDHIFKGHCPILKGDKRDDKQSLSQCYRYHFSTSVGKHGEVWNNGDGESYDDLGAEVGTVVMSIERLASPDAVVLVGHSRGGLAARSYLQSLTEAAPFQLGLMTIGTPHQGSPFGLIKHWMDREGYNLDNIWISALDFVLSPSTGYLTATFDGQGLPVKTNYSNTIWALNENVDKLYDHVSAYGQITSDGLELGENAAGYLDLLRGARAAMILPGDLTELRQFVTQNLNQPGWVTGDGIVPHDSQRLDLILSSTLDKPIWSAKLKDVPHADAISFDFWDQNPNDGETGQIAAIKNVLQQMSRQPGFTPLN